MSLKTSVSAIGIVVILCSIALGYLYQHSWSVRLTRLEVKLEREVGISQEKLDSLETELMRLQSFCRLESLYYSFDVASGREEKLGQNQGEVGVTLPVETPPQSISTGAVALTAGEKKNIP